MAGLFQAQEPMWGPRLDGFMVVFFKDEAMIYKYIYIYISSIYFFVTIYIYVYIYICWFSFLRHGECAITQWYIRLLDLVLNVPNWTWNSHPGAWCCTYHWDKTTNGSFLALQQSCFAIWQDQCCQMHQVLGPILEAPGPLHGLCSHPWWYHTICIYGFIFQGLLDHIVHFFGILVQERRCRLPWLSISVKSAKKGSEHEIGIEVSQASKWQVVAVSMYVVVTYIFCRLKRQSKWSRYRPLFCYSCSFMVVATSVVFPTSRQVNRSIQDTERVLDILRGLTWSVDGGENIHHYIVIYDICRLFISDLYILMYMFTVHIEYRHCLPFVCTYQWL